MKQVWKCDFCYDTNGDRDVIAVHEVKCQFNPATKRCTTCKHQTERPWTDYGYDCKAGFLGDELMDRQDGDVPCDKWEQ